MQALKQRFHVVQDGLEQMRRTLQCEMIPKHIVEAGAQRMSVAASNLAHTRLEQRISKLTVDTGDTEYNHCRKEVRMLERLLAVMLVMTHPELDADLILPEADTSSVLMAEVKTCVQAAARIRITTVEIDMSEFRL
jgi:hypothetical protein